MGIEQANAAYEARDQAQGQMAALKSQADREHREFEGEWKELGRLIENDKKMKEFMRQKERHKLLDDQQGDMSAEEEGRMKKKVAKSAWTVEKDEAEIADLKGQLESLKGTGGGPVNAEKQKMFGELVEKWSKIDKMAEHYELKYQQAAKTLTAV